jgi:hypothetical protein
MIVARGLGPWKAAVLFSASRRADEAALGKLRRAHAVRPLDRPLAEDIAFIRVDPIQSQ